MVNLEHILEFKYRKILTVKKTAKDVQNQVPLKKWFLTYIYIQQLPNDNKT